jgi:Protein of unknown function (DUF3417)
VWRQLDPVLWELTHNPWVVLQTVSREKLQRVLADRATVRALAGHVSRKMMEHYSHIRQRAKEAAIAGFEDCGGIVEVAREGAQNWAQSEGNEGPEVGKVLDFIGATRRIRTDDLLITHQQRPSM